jgi:hypothetical protein
VPEERADRFHSGGMALELGKAALTRPSAVAVHDDRDVVRQILRGEEGRRAVGQGRVGPALSDRGRVGRSGQRRPGH